jgi:1,4-alpha-glucan branching enzyme
MTVLLLAPSPPLLFMGEEFGAKTPFLFFCDFEGDLARAVREGRQKEFSFFCRKDAFSKPIEIPDPNAEETFLQSKLDWDSADNGEHSEWSRFYRELLQLRRDHIMSRVDDSLNPSALFSMLSERGLRASWTLKDGLELILLANLAADSLQHSTGIRGDLLYSSSASTPDQLARILPPWSASWFLAR